MAYYDIVSDGDALEGPAESCGFAAGGFRGLLGGLFERSFFSDQLSAADRKDQAVAEPHEHGNAGCALGVGPVQADHGDDAAEDAGGDHGAFWLGGFCVLVAGHVDFSFRLGLWLSVSGLRGRCCLAPGPR